MNSRISGLLLAVLGFAATANAQLWVETLNDTTLTFAFKGKDSFDSEGRVTVKTAENQGAGARVSFIFDAAAKQVTVNLTNLSGTTQWVGVGAAKQKVTFGIGTLTSFGFETAPDNLAATSFTDTAKSSLNLTPGWGKDIFNFKLAQDYTLTPAAIFGMDVGAKLDGSQDYGLSPGFGASVVFGFSGATSSVFNPKDFFFRDADPDLYDMAFRFQSTGVAGSQSSFIGACRPPTEDPCGACGSDKVALVFNLEEDYQVPEPSTYGLIGAGLLAALIVRRRMKR